MKKIVLIGIITLCSSFMFGADPYPHQANDPAAPTLVQCPICPEITTTELAYNHAATVHPERLIARLELELQENEIQSELLEIQSELLKMQSDRRENPHKLQDCPPARKDEKTVQCLDCHIIMLKSEEDAHRQHHLNQTLAQRPIKCDCGRIISMEEAWKNQLQCNHQPETRASRVLLRGEICPYCSAIIPHTNNRPQHSLLGVMRIVRDMSLADHIAQEHSNGT